MIHFRTMRRSYNFFSALIVFVISSCHPLSVDVTSSNSIGNVQAQLFNVAIDDVIEYINFSKPLTKASDCSIEPIVVQNDTVMYLVNYSDGWELFSSDRRLSRILARSDRGNINIESVDLSPQQRSNFSAIASSIAEIKHRGDFILPDMFGDTWGDGPILDTSLVHELVCVLDHSDTTIIDYAKQDHLLQTKWGQGYPWNLCAPYKNSLKLARTYTGCAVVAAAQVLYYLHNKFGVPSSTYGNATCDAFLQSPEDSIILSNNDVSFSDLSNSNWQDMPLDRYASNGFDKVAALMLRIGYLYQAKYFSNRTSSRSSLALTVFPNNFGISCDIFRPNSSDYSIYSEILEEEVCNRKVPVIMGVFDNDSLHPVGHSIVIDGYFHESKTITDTYAYYDVPVGGSVLPGQSPVTYQTTTTSEESTYVAINWGWDGSCDSDATGSTIGSPAKFRV